MCKFSPELCNTMGIHQGMEGAVAESKNAAEHNAASAMLSVLGVECRPKKSKVSTEAPIQSPRGLMGPSSGAKTAMPKLQSQQNVAAVVDHNPKEALANTAQRACGRCLVKGDVVYTTVDTGAGYVAMCKFSPELCNTMGIHQGMGGAVAESKNAAEHNAASAVLSVLGVEVGPKKSKVSTEAPIQSPQGLQSPSSGAKKIIAPMAAWINSNRLDLASPDASADASPRHSSLAGLASGSSRAWADFEDDEVHVYVQLRSEIIQFALSFRIEPDQCKPRRMLRRRRGRVEINLKDNYATGVRTIALALARVKLEVDLEPHARSKNATGGGQCSESRSIRRPEPRMLLTYVETVANTAQRACGRCLVKGDVVYTTEDTGAGYVAMCNFSSELCNTMGIHQGIKGAVAESKNASEHNAASAVLSVLGVECGPKKSKVSTEAPMQSPQGWFQGPPSGAKTAMPKLQSQQNALAGTSTPQQSPKTAMFANTGYRGHRRPGIHQGITGAVAESKNAAEHNAASAVLNVLGVECGPKKSKVSTEAPIQSPRGLQGPSSSAKKTTAPKAKNDPCRVFALFKPTGMVTTMSTDPSKGSCDMAAWINSTLPGQRLSVIGGLDKNASGLLLVTNDGQFAAGMTASRGCEKEYWCGVDVASNVDAHSVVSGTCAKLLAGFEVDHPTKPKPTKILGRAKDARQLLPEEEAFALSHAGFPSTCLFFSVTMDTGSVRVVKSMMAAAGAPSATQHLERIGGLRLTELQLWNPGSHVELSSEDIELLRSSCGGFAQFQ
ncbi:unnamed protein product [Polarella glacialis]|uniref:Pseudouridine synthase RsuA/RluA-like domain-containing protein n=1 Tax=Polarella glacialis TaxID=89957 RepID=A0A813LII4_POLGL|nr:unnamed protein product [Polarella glacialis]